MMTAPRSILPQRRCGRHAIDCMMDETGTCPEEGPDEPPEEGPPSPQGCPRTRPPPKAAATLAGGLAGAPRRPVVHVSVNLPQHPHRIEADRLRQLVELDQVDQALPPLHLRYPGLRNLEPLGNVLLPQAAADPLFLERFYERLMLPSVNDPHCTTVRMWGRESGISIPDNVPSGIIVQIFCNRSMDSSGNIWPNDSRATGRCRKREHASRGSRRKTSLTIGTDMRASTPRLGVPCK